MTVLTQGGRQVHSLSTRYNGTLFRSALEAKWAQAFDRLAIKWEYEPEAVLLSNGVTYLPDFRLPRAGQFVEVKPDAFMDDAAWRKLARLCEVSSDLAPTLFRPEFQAIRCCDNGFASAMGCREGEPYTKALFLPQPAIMRCPSCGVSYFALGQIGAFFPIACHACGDATRAERCGLRHEPFFGVHNG